MRGDRPEALPQALATGADVVSIDLEDTVLPGNKAEARAAVARLVKDLPSAILARVLVRVNSAQSGLLRDDLEALVGTGITLFNLPKPESANHVREACSLLSNFERAQGMQGMTCKMLLNVESPSGLRRAHEITAASARVVGLQIGYADLLEPYGIDREFEMAVDHIRMAVRLVAAEFDIPVYDGVYAGISNDTFFRAECMRAKRIGFTGKSCFNGDQVAIANEVFQPTPEQLATAQRIVDSALKAFAEGDGIYVLDGRIVDEPFVAGARKLLERAKEIAQRSQSREI